MRRTRPPLDRFMEKVDRTGDCWIWTASLDASGYGKFMSKSRNVGGRTIHAHRWSYEHFVGPIPPGLTLDHLCRNKSCVNPAHLEPCTIGENTRRSPTTLPGSNVRKTHCPQGHPYAGDNLIINVRRGRPNRRCATCKADRSADTSALLRRAREALGLSRDEYRNAHGFSRATAFEILRGFESTTNDPRGTDGIR